MSASIPGMTGNLLSGVPLKRGPSSAAASAWTRSWRTSWERSGSAEPGARLRATDDGLPRDQLLDGLRLAHFLGKRHVAGADGGLSVTRLRPLFENRGAKRNRSILDRVLDHASDLVVSVSKPTSMKLDEYLTSVREVEQRIDQTRQQAEKAAEQFARQGNAGSAHGAAGQRSTGRHPRPHAADVRHLAMAFQTDKTPVATLLLCRDISGLFYPFLRDRFASSGLAQRRLKRFMRINQYYCSQLAYLTSGSNR